MPRKATAPASEPPADIWTRRRAAARRSSRVFLPMWRKCWSYQSSCRCSGDVLGSEGNLRDGCPASACAPVGALESSGQGLERIPEPARAVVPGALVAADPPASRVLAGSAVPGRGQELAEDPQVAAVENAGGGGDEGGGGMRVQRRGAAERVPPGRDAAGAGDVPAEALGHAGTGDQVLAVRPGAVEQAADQPEVSEVPGGRGRLADAHDAVWLSLVRQPEQPVLHGEQVIRDRRIFAGLGWASSLAPQGRACRPAACGRAARHWAGCRPPAKARGTSQAGAPGPRTWPAAGRKGTGVPAAAGGPGRRTRPAAAMLSARRRRAAAGTGLPSPARHCGQYRVAEVNIHGLASDRGPHWSAVI